MKQQKIWLRKDVLSSCDFVSPCAPWCFSIDSLRAIRTFCSDSVFFFVLVSFYHSHPFTGVLYARWPPDFDDRPPTPTPEDANQMDVARPLAPPVEILRRPVEIPSEAQVGSVSFKLGPLDRSRGLFKEQSWSSTPRHSTVPMIISPFLALPTEAHDNNCALLKLQAYFRIVAS